MKPPLESVSVIIPTYNRATLLGYALDSVITATAPVDEIIVVDDGSTDATRDVVRSFGSRIRYVETPRSGAGAARNAGIEAASHDLVAFADSDDRWLPGRLHQQRPLMTANRQLVYSFTNFGQQFPDDRIEPNWLRHWHRDSREWSEILGPGMPCSQLVELEAGVIDVQVHIGSMYVHELQANYINVNTLLVRRSKAGDGFRFGVAMPTFEDWDCFARITRSGPGAYLAIDTALQRTHDGPRLTQAGTIVEAATRVQLIVRNWQSDTEFMATHADSVHSEIQTLLRSQARALILSGRRREARTVIAQLEHGAAERLALLIPPKMLLVLSRLRKMSMKSSTART